jgi:hypothetical protein
VTAVANVLICAEGDLGPALETTLVWRGEFTRRIVASLEEALKFAPLARLVLVERDLPWAVELVRSIRQEAATRSLSVAVVAPDDFLPVEMELLQAGANGVLRLPADSDWDKRLARLLQVAARRKARAAIQLQVEATFGPSGEPFGAETVDVSESGMLVESGVPLGLGLEVDFAFQLPGRPGLVAGRARVARVAAHHRYGLEFTDLGGEALDQLREFLQEALPKAEA